MKNEIKTYEVEVMCSNCGRNNKLIILKGQPVNSKHCPNCGCQSISIIHKPTL